MNFKKIKFNAKDKTLEVSYFELSDEITTKYGSVVHSDFIDAINALKYHFARLVDLRECDLVTDNINISTLHTHPSLNDVAVQSVVFTSQGDDDAVCISGSKRFNGKHINLTSPLTALNSDGYEHYRALNDALNTLKEETRLYMKEEKWGLKQESLFGLDAEFETSEQPEYNEVPVVEKRPKKGRKQQSADIMAS